jgi:hypothetical protein
MTMHYHGTPITPGSVLETLGGRTFCVSYAAPAQVKRCHQLGQSVMLDNGAFTFWRNEVETDSAWWGRYAGWVEAWLEYPTTWAVIPDVIDGAVEDNDALIAEWPFERQSAPVWHMHEPLARLEALCAEWGKVCVGSSGQYAELNTPQWHQRMEQAFNAVWEPGLWLHMLRGMAQVESDYPFASVDSSDIAQNHHRPQNTAVGMANRWDSRQCPSRWVPREQLAFEVAHA